MAKEHDIAEVTAKLDVIIRMMAISHVEGMTKSDAIVALDAFGLDNNEIAGLMKTTSKTVSTRLSESRRKSKAR